jgi:ribosome-associated protein
VNLDSLRAELRCAVEAARNKKASAITLLDLSALGAFTNYFVICTAFSPRQVATIAEETEQQLARIGWKLQHREGRGESEWVLLDYGSFLVHIFTERARLYYDLERLWRSGKRTVFPEADPAERSAPREEGAAEA